MNKQTRVRARSTSAALGKAGTGTEQVAVGFVVLDADGNETGDTHAWYGYFTEKTEARTIESLRILGWQGDDLSDLSTAIGGEAILVLEDEQDDEGNLYTKVRWINAIGSGALMKDPMSDSDAKAFAARMKARVRAVDTQIGKPKNNGAPRPSAPRSRTGALGPDPSYDNTDDIPF